MYLSSKDKKQLDHVKFPKFCYEGLNVLDLNSLRKDQLSGLDKLWNSISRKELKPFPEMDKDQNRKIIDDKFSEILEIPSLDVLRTMIAREPSISMKVI